MQAGPGEDSTVSHLSPTDVATFAATVDEVTLVRCSLPDYELVCLSTQYFDAKIFGQVYCR